MREAPPAEYSLGAGPPATASDDDVFDQCTSGTPPSENLPRRSDPDGRFDGGDSGDDRTLSRRPITVRPSRGRGVSLARRGPSGLVAATVDQPDDQRTAAGDDRRPAVATQVQVPRRRPVLE